MTLYKILKKDSVKRMRAIRFFIEPVFPGPLGAIQVLIDTGESIKKGSSNNKVTWVFRFFKERRTISTGHVGGQFKF